MTDQSGIKVRGREEDKTKTEDKDGEKGRDQKSEEVHRIVVSKVAEDALAAIVERVNDGFEGGRVNRNQVANWILVRFSETYGDSEIREIRTEHFDEVGLLEVILRRAKKTGQIPVEIKVLLQKQVGLEESGKRKSKKALQDNVTNDYMQGKEAE